MNGSPLHNVPPAKPKPSKDLPPIRMGDRTDQLRERKAQTAEKHKTEAKVRNRIYQDLLALLDIAERLNLDLSGHEDRYGLEWNALARPIREHYHEDLVKIIPGLQAMILSKDGAHGLPKALYRHLLDFAEECGGFLKDARSPADATPAAERAKDDFQGACARFRKACVEMRQQICIFENERGTGEESFFG